MMVSHYSTECLPACSHMETMHCTTWHVDNSLQQLLSCCDHATMCVTSAQTIFLHAGQEQQRRRLYDAIAAAQTRLTAAQRRRDLATRDLNRARSELERLRATAKGSKATKQRLTDAATAEANWVAARPQAAALLAMTAGPLTQQVCTQLFEECMGWCAHMRTCADLRRRSGTVRTTALHNGVVAHVSAPDARH
jgi:hypothetical protein